MQNVSENLRQAMQDPNDPINNMFQNLIQNMEN